MERASPSPSSAPSNAPSNRATSAPAGPIRAGNIWAPTSAGCGREVMRSSVAAGTRRSCHHRHHHRQHHQQHRHHLLQEQRGKDGAALPLEPGLAGWPFSSAVLPEMLAEPVQGGNLTRTAEIIPERPLADWLRILRADLIGAYQRH